MSLLDMFARPDYISHPYPLENMQVKGSDPGKPGSQDGLFLVTFATMHTCCHGLNLFENRSNFGF